MQPTMILLRLFHILCGVLWVGGVATTTWFLVPAVRGSGPAGGAVMRFMLVKTRFAPYFPALAGLTVLSGLLMFWWDASHSNGGFGSSPMGITLSIGALAGIIAMIYGGAVIGRSAGEMAKILRVVDASGGPPTADQSSRLTGLSDKVSRGSKVVLPMLIIAVVAMSIARYV